MLRKLLLGLVTLGLAVTAAGATCPCVHAPCEVMQCPPADTHMAPQVKLNGAWHALNGQLVALENGGHLKLNGFLGLDLDGDGVHDALGLDITGSDGLDDGSFTVALDEYTLNTTTGQYELSYTDPNAQTSLTIVPLITSPDPEAECLSFAHACPITYNCRTCSSVTWCADLERCVIMTASCWIGGSATNCTRCGLPLEPPPCAVIPPPTNPKPDPTTAALWFKKCRFTNNEALCVGNIVHIWSPME